MGKVAAIVVTTAKGNNMPRGVNIDLSSGLKTCPKCLVKKPLDQFSKSSSTVTGYQVYCKPCGSARHNEWRLKNLAKCAADQKKHRRANPERFKDYHRKGAYGLAPGEYDKMLAKQDGKCAICRRAENNGRGGFHVDHCHDLGHVRGLLCHGCNVSIGHFQHDTIVLEAAIQYLNQTSKKTR